MTADQQALYFMVSIALGSACTFAYLFRSWPYLALFVMLAVLNIVAGFIIG